MAHKRIKLIAGIVAIVGAISALAAMGVRDGWTYFLSVDEYVAQAQTHTPNQRVRVHGVVDGDSLQTKGASLEADFTILGDTSALPVHYSGVIPDMFQAGREVVVEGRVDDTGVLQADVLLTKCASKYASQDGQAPHADPYKKHANSKSAEGAS